MSCSHLPRPRAASGCAFSLWNVVQDLCIYTRSGGAMMGQLDGRTILITGAARGIGAAWHRRLAAHGRELPVAHLDPGAGGVAGEVAPDDLSGSVRRRPSN